MTATETTAATLLGDPSVMEADAVVLAVEADVDNVLSATEAARRLA